ncbi:histone-lysine N-methyltransferase SETMAR [Trichonephila clavipes]|nr:histone-lysine N-methyltransferase SETMAR [Trichonephila clavipes]
MAATIQNPAKCEVRSVIRFLHGKGRTHVHDEQWTGRPSVISDALLQRTEEAIRALGHHLGGKSFHDDDEIKDEVEMWFRQQVATFYDCGIQKLVHRLNKCLDKTGVIVSKKNK